MPKIENDVDALVDDSDAGIAMPGARSCAGDRRPVLTSLESKKMEQVGHQDIEALLAAFDAAERDARSLVNGLSEELGTWRLREDSWSIAECLDHLATSNHVYLRAMEIAGRRALTQGRLRRGPARPGLIGSIVVRTFEPPVNRIFKLRAPRSIRPRSGPALEDGIGAFIGSQDQIRTFIRQYAGIDLAHVHFCNPFVPALRFSLATGLHILAAHERRHLWQAWRVRDTAQQALAR